MANYLKIIKILGDLRLNITEYNKIHFVGIGGVSMSAIAMALADRGYRVTGSDKNNGKNIKKLKNMGIDVTIGHSADNLGDAEVIVFTGAVGDENPEILEAKSKGLPILRRTQALNIFLKDHKINIAISGTHGKTTTSCMVTAILENAGKKPNFFIGANVPMYNSAHRIKKSDFLVLEACEYQASFLDFEPNTIVVNNIDYDHVDYYSGIDHVYDTFLKFVEVLAEKDYLIVNNDDKYAKKLVNYQKTQVFSFGIENESYFMAKNISFADDIASYDFYADGKKICKIESSVLGMQNIYNSLAAYAAVYVNGINIKANNQALLNYNNASRRFELIKKEGSSVLISDYAHHPAEIIATLKTAKALKKGELVVIFQPHTFSRTKKFLKDLINSFDAADKVYIADIDPVREVNTYQISSEDIVAGMLVKDLNVHYLGSLDNLNQVVSEHLHGNNMVIAMGAGSIDKYARMI